MATKARFQAIRGTRDLLPPDTALWNRVEQTARDVFRTFGFGEIRPPIFEPTELFARAVGGETDIVSKEMYTLEDYEASDLLEHRTALLTWKDREPSQTGPLGVGMPARFQPFFELCQLFFKLARQSFDRGLVPRTPENEAFLRVFEGEVQAFQGTIQSQTLEECRRAVNSLKERTRTFVLGDSLALRPEATASVCRAYIEHNMQQWPQPVKLYYMGPMFRRERPQKGRYRQFYQIGAEVLEAARPDSAKDAAKELAKDAAVDAEVIEMVMTFFSRLRLEGAQLEINSIGHAAHAAGGENVCRREYVEKLRADLRKAKDKLGADSQRRIETNPLRVLDSKLEHEQGIIESLPRIADHLCADCKAHYAELKRQLDLRGVPYKENWRLVRGLDYYMRTTFEITARGLGSQNAVCGGGRYDGLVELLGGPPAKGIGFAIGEDRLILSLQESAKAREAGKPESPAASRQSMDVYIAWTGANTYATALRAAKNLRSAGVRVELPPAEQKFGKALERASKLGSRFALILGENEVQSGEWTLKNLADGSQQKLDEPQLLKLLSERSSA